MTTSKKEKSASFGVQDAYVRIASDPGQSCSCAGACSPANYPSLDGYYAESDYGLGCGLPTEYARIRPGDTVLDLGCGAGNDVFIARRLTGKTGKVIGLDFVPAMIDKANANKARLGYTNVEFIPGDIAHIPLPDASVDVVVSNCVLNLVANKRRAFAEIYRVLRPGGHFSISDMVFTGSFPQGTLEKVFAAYGGCAAGAISMDGYRQIIAQAGFSEIEVHNQSVIRYTPEQLSGWLTPPETAGFLRPDNAILKVQLNAIKPIL